MSHKLKAYADVEDAIDTSESYRGSSIIQKDSILIPLINVGISEHILNPTRQLAFIDFSYLLFQHFSKVLINQFTDFNFQAQNTNKRYCYVGGSEAGDLEVECQRVYLLLLNNSRLSPSQWVPVDTPFLKVNLGSEEVANFWAGIDLVWNSIDCLH